MNLGNRSVQLAVDLSSPAAPLIQAVTVGFPAACGLGKAGATTRVATQRDGKGLTVSSANRLRMELLGGWAPIDGLRRAQQQQHSSSSSEVKKNIKRETLS